MMLVLVQIAAITIVAISFYAFKAGMCRRNAQSWDSIVGRLRLDPGARRLSDQSVWNSDLKFTPEEKWQLVHGAQGLWTMYENAGVMLEMADYAARNSDTVDKEMLAELRSDAMQIRVSVLSALGKYAFSQVNESISAIVTHAGAMYTEMSARTAELLRVNGGEFVPSFAPTM